MATSNDSVAIDHRGDVRLRVGRADAGQVDDDSWHHAEFLVCSRALARASPIFDRMLYGPYAEAVRGDMGADWSVALPEDKPAPMQILLHIAHAKFPRVPLVLSVDNLYDLAVLTNYYDATGLLAPWIEAWMGSVAEISRDANVIQSKLLWISWEFGRKEDFGSIAHRMLTEEPVQPGSPAPEDHVQAPHIIESISSIRLQTIQQLLDIVADVVSRLTIADHGPRWCRQAGRVGNRQCELMILGSLSFCLARAGVWPLPETAAQVQLSLSDLYRALTNLVIHDIGATPDDPRLDHALCNPRPLLMQRVKQVMLNIPSPLTEFHVSHLERQAKRLRHGSMR